jgi:predicted nucleic acid-binding protein
VSRKLVVDANVVISALVADSTTRELIVTLEPDLLTPASVHEEIETHDDLIVEKSGLDPERVEQFVDLLFQYIEAVPAEDFHPSITTAADAIGDTDPDDVLSLACAIVRDAAIWSDDSDFGAQSLVETYSTSEVVDAFESANSTVVGAL